jgi:Uma2 family endonuclease
LTPLNGAVILVLEEICGMAIAIRDDHSWTREEYERRVEEGFFRPGERVELVDGVLYEMSPQNSPHADCTSLILYALFPLFSSDHIRVQMPLALGPDSEPEPDLAVVPGPPGCYGSSHPTSAALIVEVADSSVSHDRKRKASLYARAGVPEYWLMNLVEWHLEVFRDPVDGEYRSSKIFRPGYTVSPLSRPDAKIPVADLFPKD